MIQEIAIALLALFLILALLLAYEDDQFGGRLSHLKTKMKRSVRQTQEKLTPASMTDSRPTTQSLSTQALPSRPTSTRTAIPVPQFGGRLSHLKTKMKRSVRQTQEKLTPASMTDSRPTTQSLSTQALPSRPTSTRTAIPVPVKTNRTDTTRTAIPQSRQRISAYRRQSAPLYQEDQLKTARQSVVQRDLDDQLRTARPVNRAQASGNPPPPEPRSAGGKDKREQKQPPSDSDPQPRSDDRQPSSDAVNRSFNIKQDANIAILPARRIRYPPAARDKLRHDCWPRAASGCQTSSQSSPYQRRTWCTTTADQISGVLVVLIDDITQRLRLAPPIHRFIG
ncbi:hypothetical protein TELCIR_08925 [Teladorsagia circumcincta]|uniref:Uncharacterized protein n=1 Tax=Teladorsagia circumcincta TaxID=45464 RepID=A0A2G9UG96_TELCI|nr:hypothetical protein TELCIR_08925 [Teladorsagia circumcincta]